MDPPKSAPNVESAGTSPLTIDRLFDAPALAGPSLLNVQISPDGSRITFLKGKPHDKDRLDLWEYHLDDGVARLLVDSSILAPHQAHLSDEELNRRERRRMAALGGILEYSFAPSGRSLLFPLDGQIYLYQLATPTGGTLLPITQGDGFATDAKCSPRGSYVAYIRDQNLYGFDLSARREFALTTDGGGAIKNGMAEFVAQEEMGRSTGYWWSPDDAHIAFIRVDETPVEVTQRFEISADNVRTFAQRYPSAGRANVLVRLGVTAMNGDTIWLDVGHDPDIYLARVDWLPDGKAVAIQRQSRDQRRLDLLFADIATGASRIILTETSESWLELHHELTFLERSREFLWASMRDGFQHLYLYDYQGRLLRQLTAGPWNVDDFHARAIKAVDETSRRVYFTATAESPLERHLYRVSLDPADPGGLHRITTEPGLHGIEMSLNAKVYVDTFSSVDQPPQVSLRDAEGRLIAWLVENRLDVTHPDAAYLASNSQMEFGTLLAEDGQILHFRLFKPANFDPARRHPAIVDVYGGPGVQRVLNTWTGSSFSQILTRSGYVVFQLDNRGTASRGTTFQAPLQDQTGRVEVADQVRGARWLAEQPYIDPQRVGVWGWSYGGYMTLMLMFRAPDVFKAGVSGAPVSDWTLYDTHYTERYLGRPQDNPSGYEASSVLSYAENLRGRLLIIHGMADDNVLLLHSTKLFRRLQDLGKPFDIMVYPGAKHGLLRQHDGRHAYATMLRFFERNL
jgi:dipeptidyl-peptidase-4